MTSKLLVSGQWHTTGTDGATKVQIEWTVGQLVDVLPRTWSGINRPGGHGTITHLHRNSEGVVTGLDVTYTVSRGRDLDVHPNLVKPYQELERSNRRRKLAENLDKENNKPSVEQKKTSKSKTVRKKAKPDAVTKKSNKTLAVDTRAVLSPSIPREVTWCDDDDLSMVSELVLGEEPSTKRTYMLSPSKPQQATSFGEINLSRQRSETSFSSTSNSPRARSLASGEMQAPEPLPSSARYVARKSLMTGLIHIIQPKTTNHVSLEHVYDKEKQKAVEFCNKVVKNIEDDEASSCALSVLAPHNDLRKDLFGSLLCEILQLTDGVLEEDGIVAKVNERMAGSDNFTEDQADEYLTRLVTENKLMRADGQIYLIL